MAKPKKQLIASEQAYDTERKREDRAEGKDVAVGECEDRARREALETDDVAWLLWYFGEGSGSEAPFTYEFTLQQREMITAIRAAMDTGGDQALAASRGEGKTIIAERMLLKGILTGVVKFAVLFAATGTAAENSLDSIKAELETNERLWADYREVCDPIRALENAPNRAHYQTVSGKRHDNREPYTRQSSKFSWCGKQAILPNVPGSPCALSVIATRGLDSAVRGLKKKGRRVDLAIIDDPDTEKSASSEEQAKKLETRIDRAIAGLGGQTRRIARVILTTLQNRTCVSYKYCDPTQKPSWKGKRFRFLVTPPDRTDLWDEYIRLCVVDWNDGTTTAHEFYVANRDAMDAGAVVSNPNRYAQGELSALQHYYGLVARLGPEAVATEYDNDPPEETQVEESGLTSTRIQKQVSGFPKRIVPQECTLLVQGIDVGKKLLHWVVRAFKPDATGYTVDWGTQPVYGTRKNSDEGLDAAIRLAVEQRMYEIESNPYHKPDGELVVIKQTLVDAGYRTEGVYSLCSAMGLAVKPVMGCGESAGCARRSFSPYRKDTPTQKTGYHFNQELAKKSGNVWRIDAETDFWKRWEHDRWMTDPGMPGCMYMAGEPGPDPRKLSQDQYENKDYAVQIVAEVEADTMVRGSIKRKFVVKHVKNHWLDASYYANVAAAMHGIRLMRELAVAAPVKSKSLAELAAIARGA